MPLQIFKNLHQVQKMKEPLEIFISKQWYSDSILNTEDAVITTNKKGIVITMNGLAEGLTGWSLTDSIGQPIEKIFDAINEVTHLPIENPINKALKENKATLLANHTILIKKDKTQRVIVDSAVPIHNEDFEIIGGALIFRDVTELSAGKEKLLLIEGMLKGIMGNTDLLISITDLEGNYLLFNSQKEKLYNIKAEELIGKNSMLHLTKEEAVEAIRTDKQVLRQNRPVEFEQILKHPDRTYHIYSTTKFPLYDSENKLFAIAEISTDITKLIEIDEQLAIKQSAIKKEIQYDELTKDMPNLFFSLDSSLHHTSFNSACEKFTGRKAEEVIGKTIQEVFPDGVPLFISEYKEVLKTRQAKNFISTFTISENTFTYIVNIYPAGNGISVLMTDLTKQRKSELESNERVEHLQEQNNNIRLFANAVYHDLTAPISRVLGLANLYKLNPDDKINNLTILEIVVNEITNLGNVVRDMNSSIILHDNDNKLLEYINFDSVLTQIKNVHENEILKSKAFITSSFHNPEGMVTVKSYLYSIMNNLLSNAIKYRLPEVPLTIHLQTQENNEFICLIVKDNGKGIDMEKHGEKLFGLYNRFHKEVTDGKGIGLNLVKKQVESLGGTIEVESSINHGSTFKIFFPVIKIQEVLV